MMAASLEKGGGVLGEASQRMAGRILDNRKASVFIDTQLKQVFLLHARLHIVRKKLPPTFHLSLGKRLMIEVIKMIEMIEMKDMTEMSEMTEMPCYAQSPSNFLQDGYYTSEMATVDFVKVITI